MAHVKLPPGLIKIEDKLEVKSYKTVAYDELSDVALYLHLNEREFKVLTAIFQQGLLHALTDCVTPQMIARFGDEQLKKNYLEVFALAESLGVLKGY